MALDLVLDTMMTFLLADIKCDLIMSGLRSSSQVLKNGFNDGCITTVRLKVFGMFRKMLDIEWRRGRLNYH